MSEVGAAALLGIGRTTLWSWRDQWLRGRRRSGPRGRRTQRATTDQRKAVLSVLRDEGPGVPIAQLRGAVPGVARRELEDLKARVARAGRRRRWWSFGELEWREPGRVWAGDFSQTPCRIEGRYDRLMLARDLASDMQLLAQPAVSESADESCLALDALFAEEGAPLVLKLDNGSGFIASRTRDLVDRHGVLVLHSPPGTPSYNGSCEAGNGSIKMRARRLAGSRGRPGAWTMNDVEAARCEANEREGHGEVPSPAQEWARRKPITHEERAALRAVYDTELARLMAEEEQKEAPWQDRSARATLERRALTSALIQRGYLVIRKGRVCPLNRRRKRSGIS